MMRLFSRASSARVGDVHKAAERKEEYFLEMIDYARGKPFPDPFLEAARRLNVAPAECLVFEDSPLGVQAGLTARAIPLSLDKQRRSVAVAGDERFFLVFSRIGYGEIPAFDRAFGSRIDYRTDMAEISQAGIEVRAPKERNVGVATCLAHEHAGDMLTLALGVYPVLYADHLAGVRVGVASNVADCKNAGHRGLELLVDIDASSLVGRRALKPGGLREPGARRNADTKDDEVSLNGRTIIEREKRAVEAPSLTAEMKMHALFLVHLSNHICDLGAK
jgi:hypothetical protein